LTGARGDLAATRTIVAGCRNVPWTGSAAASRYRQALDDEDARLGRLVGQLDAMLAEIGVSGPWPVPTGLLLAAGSCRGSGGRSLRVGDGSFVVVDPEALADAAVRLGRAAGDLDDAAASLSRALWSGALSGGTPALNSAGVWGAAARAWGPSGAVLGSPAGALTSPAQAAAHALNTRIAALLGGPDAPADGANRLRGLAATTRAVAQVQRDGETTAHARARALAGTLGQSPLVGAAAATPLVTGELILGATRAKWSAELAMATGENPIASLQRTAGQEWTDAIAAGSGDLAVQGVAGALLSASRTATADPVPVAAGLTAALLAHTGSDVVAVPRADTPQLAAPQGLAGALDAVAKSYEEAQPTGLPGTLTATVTLERLDHPDGTRSWLVAIPGTQAWGFSHEIATDMGTNLQLVAGMTDPITSGVLKALRDAGVGSDEPVVFAGHSQGGMVAVAAAAAAAGSYRVGGVVTAGSPSVPEQPPAAVPVVRLEHDEDVVPQTDGRPTQVAGNVTRISQSMSDDHPAMANEAHGIGGYLQTAQLADEGAAAAPGSVPGVDAVTAVLGGDGTTATTFQYRVERMP